MSILNASLCRQLRGLEAKEFSSAELTGAYLDAIDQRDPLIHAFLHLCRREALEAARTSDLRRARGELLGPLDGIPFGVKDNLCTRGIPTTCGSRYLEGYLPPYSATVVERLSRGGAVLLGKLNMDEFAMGSTTEYSAFFPTANPRDLTRSPGGSSGGSAAAVAAGLVAFSLGSDTGGSVRQPASHCGVVGMKPTYGTVSRYGLCAHASSLEQIGPLTRTVEDNALVLSLIRGVDPMDATTVDPSCAPLQEKSLSSLRVGIPLQLLEQASPSVRGRVLAAADALRSFGVTVEELSLPSLEYAAAAYSVLSAAEASSNLARMDGVRFGNRAPEVKDPEELYRETRSHGFGREVKRRILLGTFVLSEGYFDRYYQKAANARDLLCRELTDIFSRYELLLSPSALTTAPLLGLPPDDPTIPYREDLCTVPANLAGIPGLSVPFGVDEGGLPVGIQLMGPAHSEPLLYRVGGALERLCREGDTL